MIKKTISIGLKLAVTLGLFILLFRPQTYGLRPDLFGGVTPKSLWNELMSVDPRRAAFWLTFALVMKLSGMLAGVLRWRLLLYGQDARMPFWYMVQSWFVGRMFGIFLPSTIGLDGYRFYDSSVYTREPIKCVTVIAVEKLIGFISLTFLMFLTFPLGFRLLKINPVMLVVILCALAAFVTVSFLLLLSPRVLQILVAVLPTPGFIRNKIDKLGAAVTAYSRRRSLLLLAVLCGLWVHLGTVFTFFGTMMALRAPNTSLIDILFASPIMIYGTVLGPSIGGEGIREIVFGILLGAKSGVSTAVLFSHLGWWVGDVVPFLIGIPIFLLRSRPAYKLLQAELADARERVAKETANAEAAIVHLSPEATREYRSKLISMLLAGAAAGLLIGSAIGLGEASWINHSFSELHELTALWWGPGAYGAFTMFIGIGVACALAFICLLFDRFPSTAITFALSLAGVAQFGSLIGVWRFKRDILMRHAFSSQQLLVLALVIAAGTAFVAIIGWFVASKYFKGRVKAGFVCILVYALSIAGGYGYGVINPPPPRKIATIVKEAVGNPNIFLVVVDALRADYLKMYSKDARVDTPHLDALAHDSVRFDKWFSQAPWTKPSFATIFSGLYPETHTATTQVSMLPDSIVTFPEVLEEGGYFTVGFSNNPNIYSSFGFSQGFTDYVDLVPRMYFCADYSATRLALYEILRRGWYMVSSRFTSKLDVMDFYQPAETVTGDILNWIDGTERPKKAPFMLFAHYMDPHDPFMDHKHPGVGYARAKNQHPDPEMLGPMRDAYDSEIVYFDEYIGKLVEGLRQRGLYDGSFIILTADHGEEFQDHHGWWHGQTLFDEVLHVPMLMKFPNQQKAGIVNTDFGRHIDIAPTILQFAGLQKDKAMQGESIISPTGEFDNGKTTSVYSENDFENNVMQSLRTFDCKLIHANPDNARNRAPVEAYNLAADPAEKTNIAGKNEKCETELESILNQMTQYVRGQAAEPKKVSGISGEQTEQLKSLGYLDK